MKMKSKRSRRLLTLILFASVLWLGSPGSSNAQVSQSWRMTISSSYTSALVWNLKGEGTACVYSESGHFYSWISISPRKSHHCPFNRQTFDVNLYDPYTTETFYFFGFPFKRPRLLHTVRVTRTDSYTTINNITNVSTRCPEIIIEHKGNRKEARIVTPKHTFPMSSVSGQSTCWKGSYSKYPTSQIFIVRSGQDLTIDLKKYDDTALKKNLDETRQIMAMQEQNDMIKLMYGRPDGFDASLYDF